MKLEQVEVLSKFNMITGEITVIISIILPPFATHDVFGVYTGLAGAKCQSTHFEFDSIFNANFLTKYCPPTAVYCMKVTHPTFQVLTRIYGFTMLIV